MAMNNTKLNKKIYVKLSLCFNNAIVNCITSVQTKYVLHQDESGKAHWAFDQFEGNIYTERNGKVIPTQAKWYWGVDKREGSRNRGHLYRDLGKDGDPYKVVLMSHGCVPFDPWSIAEAVHTAVTTGEGVIPNPFEALVPAQEPAPTSAPAMFEQKVVLSEITPEDAAAVDEDVALLDGDGKDPLTRLKIGDPSLFIELGFAEGQALNWAMQIRSGSVSVNDVEDVKNIRGIGRKNAAKLKAALKAKYAA